MNSEGVKFENMKEIRDFLKLSQTDLAKLYSKMYKNDIFIVGKEKEIYYYNEVEKLWKCETREVYVGFVADFLNNTSKNLVKKFTSLRRELDEDEDNEAMSKLQQEVKGKAKGLDSTKAIEDLIKVSTGHLQCNDFETKLNVAHDYFPMKDGKKIHLPTLTISDRTKDDYFSFECPVEYVKDTPNADKFFGQLMPNEANREFLRKSLGYCISGDTSAQCFFIWYGSGSNGKGELFRTIEMIMTKFFRTLGDGIFEDDNKKGASPDKMDLMGGRLGSYNEGKTADEMELNMPLLKRLSGQDAITTRALYQNNVTFRAFIKLIMATNYIPSVGEDDANKRRLKYVFFDSCFKSNPDITKPNEFKKDEDFVNQIQTIYLSEVFSWICQGAKSYYVDKKMEMTEEFTKRTNEIFQKEDSISSFFQNRMKITNDSKDTIRRGDFFETYKEYCNKNSQRCKPRSTVFKRMEDLKIVEGKLHGYDVYRGIQIVIDGSVNEVVYTQKYYFGPNIQIQFDHIMKLEEMRAQLMEERKQNQLIIDEIYQRVCRVCTELPKKPHCFDNLKSESIIRPSGKKWLREEPEVHAKLIEGMKPIEELDEEELEPASFDQIVEWLGIRE